MPSEDGYSSLDNRNLDRMKLEILEAEKQNSQTREKNNDAMVDLIRRTIISIADRTY
ncbi:hypothetical protein [Olsenella uli]|uniref:hypothetical protein n=1 Tax=Olsenella uli TaxID=133926 RepID=UPI0024A7C82B|nr:hypothetical protein [Olsenella uli]